MTDHAVWEISDKSPEKLSHVIMEFDEYEAKGKIEIERTTYGAVILVNGEALALIDLFHLSSANADKDQEASEPYPQICIYDRDYTDTLGFISWHSDTIKMLMDRQYQDINAVTGKHQSYLEYERDPKE